MNHGRTIDNQARGYDKSPFYDADNSESHGYDAYDDAYYDHEDPKPKRESSVSGSAGGRFGGGEQSPSTPSFLTEFPASFDENAATEAAVADSLGFFSSWGEKINGDGSRRSQASAAKPNRKQGTAHLGVYEDEEKFPLVENNFSKGNFSSSS